MLSKWSFTPMRKPRFMCMNQTKPRLKAASFFDFATASQAKILTVRKSDLLNVYKMSRPNVKKILYKNVQLVCLS